MVFSQSAPCLLTLETVSSTEQKVLGVMHPAYPFVPSQTRPLALCLKRHHQTQGHLGFPSVIYFQGFYVKFRT